MAVATVESTTLEKIISFINDTGYKELMQNSARFNVRIRKDRIYRQPYIDGQTGVAQRHCHLFVSDRHRMPGILQGQVYTYPARRWKAQRRSYLGSLMQATDADPDEHTITTVENPAAIVTAVEEPVPPPEKVVLPPDQWATYFDEGPFEDELEDEFESEEDLDDETYSRKGSKRKKAPVGRKPKAAGGLPKKASKKKTPENSSQRGGKKKTAPKTPSKVPKNIKKDDEDPSNKPYGCELCGMRYKTRPGLTYHYAHSHKEEKEEEAKPKAPARPNEQIQANDPIPDYFPGPLQASATPQWGQNSYYQVSAPGEPQSEKGRKKVSASPYCDFCLGDATENKKTGAPESLVSCADCGRSGHPSCLQFTSNMMKSVVKYRWQCIECKTCTLCGTSENDDQLLFCDDCDRGYHLYCLDPPLSEPPEGEWSCYLCIQEFHAKKSEVSEAVIALRITSPFPSDNGAKTCPERLSLLAAAASLGLLHVCCWCSIDADRSRRRRLRRQNTKCGRPERHLAEARR
ncbi:zinc finger protein ubi-d4-like isoform X4 [Eriocheir sinensis]|uniref:zinc finger protein ubi-d4-like isoform X4 n=1 Tax=Eriocheir sinensis TaxID=95602 RepID=UPI0021C61FD0|nr:zinc finger protein ubi-d4-like isoform X4 [Eriocheir sinensis]